MCVKDSIVDIILILKKMFDEHSNLHLILWERNRDGGLIYVICWWYYRKRDIYKKINVQWLYEN